YKQRTDMSTIQTSQSYTPKKWNLSALEGISDKTLEVHFGLYEGYVKNSNLLAEQIAELTTQGKAAGTNPQFAELVRRLGFEYNGMVLHEYYFDNMTSSGGGAPAGALADRLKADFGDFETWKKQFSAIGTLRGVGWVVLYEDSRSGRLTNHWITLHEEGNIAGFKPVLVMDVWEHAWLLDYKPAQRSAYVEAFFANVDWKTVAARLSSGH
ncbi:MAG TPA: Fe-Mn family superoxide dismutase, partial [Candidatus Baltobacteraceae bacterium]